MTLLQKVLVWEGNSNFKGEIPHFKFKKGIFQSTEEIATPQAALCPAGRPGPLAFTQPAWGCLLFTYSRRNGWTQYCPSVTSPTLEMRQGSGNRDAHTTQEDPLGTPGLRCASPQVSFALHGQDAPWWTPGRPVFIIPILKPKQLRPAWRAYSQGRAPWHLSLRPPSAQAATRPSASPVRGYGRVERQLPCIALSPLCSWRCSLTPLGLPC